MNVNTFFEAEFEEHATVVADTRARLAAPFATLLEAAVTTIKNGGKIILFGNGGSAADAQHLATELTVRYKSNRSAIAAIALTTDTSALTAIGNDLGFERLFARQVEALGKPDDLVIAISTSGQSENIIQALDQATSMGMKAAGFSGKDGGRMVGKADPLLIVPSQTTARIQEMHIMLGQMLCGALEIELGLVS